MTKDFFDLEAMDANSLIVGDGFIQYSIYCMMILFSPFVGSFLGVLIRRVSCSRPVIYGRSECDACNVRLSPSELIPLLSYLFQKGRCRSCNARIDKFYPVVELAATAVAVIATLVSGPNTPLMWGNIVLGWGLLTLAWIDAETWRLPDILTLPLLIIGFLEPMRSGDSATLADRLIAAIVGWLILSVVGSAYKFIRGRVGLGRGDIKLFAVGGAWTGLSSLPSILLISAALGIGTMLILRFLGQKVDAGTAIPFGPYLGIAIWVVRLTT